MTATLPPQTDSAAPLDELRALAPAAIAQVRTWLEAAAEIPVDPAAAQLAGVLRDPKGLDFTVGFVDGVVRPEDLAVAARNLRRIAGDAPGFLPATLRGAVRLGGGIAPVAPGVVVPIARRVLREMVGHLIIDATDRKLGAAIEKIRVPGVRLNLNLLGEAVLGRGEASRRLDGTRELLARDDVDYVSIKVSSTVAPHQAWAFDEAVAHVVEELTPLYRLAATSPTPKFINLDMEEYKDLELTMAVFTRLLDRDEFLGLEAGIVLQAYLPDALEAMIRLQEWSAARVARGGAPVKVRLVKGANLPMEHVEASLHGWPLATWSTKQDSDTNYKRVIDYALRPEHVANVRIGVAGHNLFDVAFSWLLAKQRGVTEGIEYEMLLGMAQGQAEVVRRDVGSLLLYTPVVHPREFDVAIAYLIRRLEEGASQENFMSAVFELAENEDLFEREKNRFLASLDALDREVPASKRVQDRRETPAPLPADRFEPTPDSDPSLPGNQAWARGIRERARASTLGRDTIDANTVGDADELEARIRTALDAGPNWRELTGAERAAVLHRAGDELERRRAELMEVAAAEAGKTLDQSDPEVSEAVDFAHFYAELARGLDHVDGAEYDPSHLIVVTPPWNFPVAIPAGSTLAALASGASVIIKPAKQAARCGAVMVEALWAAGVPRDALQYVQFSDRDLGRALVADPAVDRVILTGGYETAERFRSFRPELQLLAETSGKNAIIVTPSADYDLAAKDVVQSAFGHAGQKCSASSLVILVGQAARSRRFREQLLDAVRSLEVGYPWDANAMMGPIIGPAEGKLLDGLTTLGEGERWAVEPRKLDDSGTLWSPGVRVGVRRGSEYHLVEYFGPILGVMTADTLEDAIELVNEIDYGLTSGLHSLDRDEIDRWQRSVQAGNLYVNRGITGAIVQRQPFGGWKKSVVGATTKAGGPNYLVGLGDWHSAPAVEGDDVRHDAARHLLDAARRVATGPATDGIVDAEEADGLERALRSDEIAWRTEFGADRDVQGLLAERNVFRYRAAAGDVLVRLAEGARVAELVRVVAAGLRAGARLRVSSATELPSALKAAISSGGVPVTVEDDAAFERTAVAFGNGRIRLVGGDRVALAEAVGGRPDLAIYANEVTESGRIELLPFLREQAVSVTAHRFGTPNHLTDGLF
ncbi:aldehyde dehydrogenase family protein [Pseudoclavibacter chungangensis]|uniref:L-glutamate gamma-semialdehyde dehydrogenase n=1 Tax=Pseudoclavibacter chungangensis TaxID=587635 RepID=A0A7J5C023_9MICO|nr:bifunctional proline dehydrogenase/L-glutamate gamma-semialdehyde dehydrogenase [Pseudoclavibacter chungangensis]KAB1660254.1 aldehyde dehydrogenase family protein [Pseudoclavibacter chungangensis]NYJ65597.1 RHH-type proline utilization regulon transcriptional repressor/proline dehydrogenase/delta 1-pyrroline-5-carboxylate dehydrogenase [Pseudoclavibacter chungangensis]